MKIRNPFKKYDAHALLWTSLFVVLLTINSSFAQGVTERRIEWHANQYTELHSGQQISESCTLVTNELSIVTLTIGAQNALVFNITGTEGMWQNTTDNGSLVYHVTYQGRIGQITLTRNGDEIIALIDFTVSSETALKLQVNINSFE